MAAVPSCLATECVDDVGILDPTRAGKSFGTGFSWALAFAGLPLGKNVAAGFL